MYILIRVDGINHIFQVCLVLGERLVRLGDIQGRDNFVAFAASAKEALDEALHLYDNMQLPDTLGIFNEYSMAVPRIDTIGRN